MFIYRTVLTTQITKVYPLYRATNYLPLKKSDQFDLPSSTSSGQILLLCKY